MTEPADFELDGRRGRIVGRRWQDGEPRFVVLLAHGYAEHSGRYQHVADRLVADGAVVYAPDHLGHGRSDGEPALIEEGEDLTADLHGVAGLAVAEHPGLPVVLIGHSMGGMIATRYTQQHGDDLAALVLSGPVVGGNPGFQALLELDPLPDVPIDVAVLSRDPAVGEAYTADPLVYSGPFKRATLTSLFDAVARIGEGPGFGDLPVLWIHGEEDALAPLEITRQAMEHLRGPGTREKVYPGARHEIFNETNQDEVLDDVVAFVREALGS